MGSRCILHLLLVLSVVAVPPMTVADNCGTSAVNTVSISASSYRNKTGHWIAKAVLTREISSGFTDVRIEERPFNYDIKIRRQSCDGGEILTTTYNILAPPARVGADYTFFPNIGYYKLHTDKQSWEDARRICESEGAHLAIVNSEAEENAIVELMKPHDIQYFAFIGFHDKHKEGEYVTVLGDPLNATGHVRWSGGEPNNAFDWAPEGEDCGAMYTFGAINDVSCGGPLTFVCEQSL